MKYVLALVVLFVLIVAAVAAAFRLGLFKHESELHLAAMRQDWAEVTRLVENGADPDEPFRNGAGTVLHLASRFAPEDTVRVLLDAGADPNLADTSGETPFHYAVRAGRLENVRLLLDHGVDINLANGSGISPGALAATGPNRMVEALLRERGARMDWGGMAGWHMGQLITAGDVDGVREMLDGGVSPDVEIPNGPPPCQLALISGKPEVARLLIKRGADPHAPGEPDWGMYLRAIRRRDVATVQLMLELGLSPNGLTPDGVSPLVLAEMYGRDEVAALMAEHGAKRRWDGLEEGRLFEAVYDGDEQEVKAALAEGQDPNAKGPVGITPLRLAALRDRKAIVTVLLDAGADPDVPGPRGLTLLHTAASRGDIDLVRELLDHGAFVNPDDGRSATPLAYAHEAGYEDVAALLEERGGREVAVAPDLGLVGPEGSGETGD
jgi:ankyrin repeat protein